jgi:2-oxoglutarate ferredoxin oxidoreductase subunit beta
MTEMPKYTKKDFVSDQEVRWCPGCGDYAILNSVQMAMSKIGKKKEDIAFISGIGCSSRFPYYMSTYGLHTIHGRAPAFASGLKCHNPDLSVWMITGDGDGLSIGGNHLIHLIRRNVNINVILFNNEIYGLTKGQYSPTTPPGQVTKSTPFGSLDRCFLPGKLALGAGSTFFARTMDTDPKHMQEVFLAAEQHQGCSFIEVLQNCVIFNDKTHENYTNRKTRDEWVFFLEDGKPIIFGKEKNKGLRLNGAKLEVVTIGENGVTEDDLVKHDVTDSNLAFLLNNLVPHRDPVAMGIVHQVNDLNYDAQMISQIKDVSEKKGKMSMQEVLKSGSTWTVK